MQKFDQRHNNVHYNRIASRKLRKFHCDHMRYNITKKREFDEFDGEFYWDRNSELADLNHEDFQANSCDYNINRRCRNFTGIRPN
jgi:hypothetical protein